MGRRRRTRRMVVTATAGAAAALLAGAVAAPAANAAAAGPHRMAGTASTWTRHAKDLGRATSGQQVQFGVLLNMRDRAGADRTLQAISTPGSASYGHWLSSAQYRSRYAPASSDVARTKSWLASSGFHVTDTFPSGAYLTATGTVAQLNRTFGVDLHQYRYGQQDLRGSTRDLSLPASAPSAIAGIFDVAQTPHLNKPASTPSKTLPGPGPGFKVATPCSTYDSQKVATNKPPAYGKHQPWVACGYTAKQYQAAYGIDDLIRKGYDGRGVTVAITDAYASPTIVKDITKYNKTYGLPAYKKGQFSQVLPPRGFGRFKACGPQGWYGEETLDIEAVHGMAPGATIKYVGGGDCGTGLDTAWAKTIDSHLADVVTNSWGNGTEALPAELVKFYDQFALEAALTGITDNFSSGDAGDEVAATGKKQISLPSSDPYVSAIGGTSIGISKSGKRTFEYGWQNAYSTLTKGKWTPAPPGTYSSGGGGGTSVLFKQPAYQKGKVPAKISKYFSKTPHRAIPDISMPGDPNTGFVVGQTQQFPDGTYWATYRIGGTSLSSPLVAGLDAIAGQYAGQPIGFANPLYYSLLGHPGLHDIVPPTHPVARVRADFVNQVDPSDGYTYKLQTIDVQSTTIHTLPGYDDETGVGSPDPTALFSMYRTVLKH